MIKLLSLKTAHTSFHMNLRINSYVIEVCTTNFGNLNRPHFSSYNFTNKIANRAKKPDKYNFF